SLRGDHYQIPNTAEQQAAGIRDLDLERDAFVNFSWVHTGSSGMLLTVSPFYHFNSAHYVGGAGDTPIIPEQNTVSNYLGAQTTLSVVRGKHNARAGFETYGERENNLFGLQSADSNIPTLRQQTALWGNLEAAFLEDQYKPLRWLSLNAGARLTRFSGGLSETAASPRVGGAVEIPRLGWVLRAFYGRYYQPPPLSTVSGPILDLAASQGFGFLPLRGERDEQREFGLTVPFRGWAFDVTNFRTAANNFFDHDVLGNSNIFFPLTIQRARIRGWEATIRSPRLLRRVNYYLAFSHQIVEGQGGVTGGLTDFQPPEGGGYYFLDHDQRNTLSTGATVDLPWRAWASAHVAYGSGFLNGDGPAHLPAHTTLDLQLGKSFGEAWSVNLYALNAGNSRYLLDNSNTFGGTHFANPRQFGLEVRYRFHY
ncbi:MAG: TonB-dependent receptor, partial [Acidobacteriia bacterium]|nr:TonB-dependent receptor [Terriglobia bacterium]